MLHAITDAGPVVEPIGDEHLMSPGGQRHSDGVEASVVRRQRYGPVANLEGAFSDVGDPERLGLGSVECAVPHGAERHSRAGNGPVCVVVEPNRIQERQVPVCGSWRLDLVPPGGEVDRPVDARHGKSVPRIGICFLARSSHRSLVERVIAGGKARIAAEREEHALERDRAQTGCHEDGRSRRPCPPEHASPEPAQMT